MILRDFRFSPGLTWSRAIGRVARLPLPAPVLRGVISGYTRLLHIEVADVAIPAGGWESFGEFFARRLLPEARVIDDDSASLSAPCDGLIEAVGPLRGARFVVKGRSYDVRELTGRSGWWDRAERGGYVVIYLSPADYHRVHGPVDCGVRGIWRLPGTCFPVNRIGQAVAPWAVVRNERVVFDLTTEGGSVAVVMVGALGVRAIGVSVPDPEVNGDEIRLERADELGAFNLGSTVVMLWEGDADVSVRVGERILLGQRVVLRR